MAGTSGDSVAMEYDGGKEWGGGVATHRITLQ